MVKVCNGYQDTLQTTCTGWTCGTAVLKVSKNAYGLEVNVPYFWYNPGPGDDRRRIETTVGSSFKWLCNGNDDSPSQSLLLKYRVLSEDPRTIRHLRAFNK